MQTFVRVMCTCYSMLLILHSRRLREAYGQEMVNVLREQMLDALQSSGTIGPLRAAARALGELLTVALPSRLNNSGVAVFSIAISASFGMQLTVYRIVLNPDILDPWMRTLGLQCR